MAAQESEVACEAAAAASKAEPLDVQDPVGLQRTAAAGIRPRAVPVADSHNVAAVDVPAQDMMIFDHMVVVADSSSVAAAGLA